MSDNLNWVQQNKQVMMALGAVIVGAFALGYILKNKDDGSDYSQCD